MSIGLGTDSDPEMSYMSIHEKEPSDIELNVEIDDKIKTRNPLILTNDNRKTIT